jgi:hypothetical protein
MTRKDAFSHAFTGNVGITCFAQGFMQVAKRGTGDTVDTAHMMSLQLHFM